MKPHKHADLIKAWADGAVIEAKYYKATGWTDWEEQHGGFIWYEGGAEYRIKPSNLLVLNDEQIIQITNILRKMVIDEFEKELKKWSKQ
jgi:hypothetical protein